MAELGRRPRSLAQRQKQSDTMKRRGHAWPVRGRRGELSVQQAALLAALSDQLAERKWVAEFAIGLNPWPGPGWPKNYSIDIACVNLKIGIEVDGRSHNMPARRVSDRKRDRYLRTRGWLILRVKNDVVTSDVQRCVLRIRRLVKHRIRRAFKASGTYHARFAGH